MTELPNECQTFSHIDKDGNKVFKPKKTYHTLDEAIEVCKKLNANSKQISKLVSYKCRTCFKYHIGRNGKTIKEKYRNKLRGN